MYIFCWWLLKKKLGQKIDIVRKNYNQIEFSNFFMKNIYCMFFHNKKSINTVCLNYGYSD